MVRILAASSLHHAIETVKAEDQKLAKEKVYSIPGLSLNIHAKNPKKVVQNLIEKDFKDEKDLIIWHDVINNSICRHKSNSYRALSVSDLVDVLKSYQNRIRALVYCQRDRTPDIFTKLQETNILVLNIAKRPHFIAKAKRFRLFANFKGIASEPRSRAETSESCFKI